MKTYLALRKKDGEGFIGWLTSLVIKIRLVTKYPHAGIVLENDRGERVLYHSSAQKGVNKEVFDESGWDLIQIDNTVYERTLNLFDEHSGSKYDWWSLLAFILIPARDKHRWYCYEWCYECITGKSPIYRITPEDLLYLVMTNEEIYNERSS